MHKEFELIVSICEIEDGTVDYSVIQSFGNDDPEVEPLAWGNVNTFPEAAHEVGVAIKEHFE